jgi:2-(1,2-epoxy-1,2-dihydrophenyl)acetyl-CoA isomerase
MTAYTSISGETRDGVGHVTLNRPESANSLNATLSSELMDAVVRCEDDPGVRAVVVTGAGPRFFCAGADLKGFYSTGSELKSRVSIFHAVLSRLARADFPVIAAVNGAAAGAGMGLACACDLVIAAESARFTMAYTKIGLSPDGSTTYFLPRRIGIGRALELALLNRTLSAEEALQWGIVKRRSFADADSLARRLPRANERAHVLAIDERSDFFQVHMSKELLRLGGGIDTSRPNIDLIEASRLEFCAVVRLFQSARDTASPELDAPAYVRGHGASDDNVRYGKSSPGA